MEIGVYFTPDYICYRDGRVLSCFTNKIMKGDLNRRGYHQVGLTIGGLYKKRRTHRIVAICYIENPFNKKEVNHIDGNKLNNCVENLEWVTCQENITHYHESVKDHDEYKLSVFDVLYIKEFRRSGKTMRSIAEIFNISLSTVYEISHNLCCKTHLRTLGYIQ